MISITAATTSSTSPTEFEEVAFLLVHGSSPTGGAHGVQGKLRSLRGIPMDVQDILESIPASTHPMDVLRTACSAMGAVLPEGEDHKLAEARDNRPPDGLPGLMPLLVPFLSFGPAHR
jgi:citrate synthase